MANIVMILGASKSGKSTSIRTLNPDETIILNPLGKTLPFKGFNKMYNKKKGNFILNANYNDVITQLKRAHETPAIKNVIIDDAIYLMRKEYFDRVSEKTYDKYTEMALHFQKMFSLCEKIRLDINVFVMLHIEEVKSDTFIKTYKASTIGNLMDKQYNPIEVVTNLLFCQPKFDDKGKPEYGFYTHKCIENNIEIPAGTPAGMFEDDFIPNDLQFVADKINEYNN